MKTTQPKSNTNEIEDLIASDHIEEAVQKLREVLELQVETYPKRENVSKLRKSVIIQQSRLSSLNAEIQNGKLDFEDSTLEKTRIKASLLDIVATLKEKIQLPTLENETRIPKEKIDVEIQKENITIELTIDKELDKFPEIDQKRLLKAIQELLSMDEEVQINKIRKGSTILTIQIPKNKYSRLVGAYAQGILDTYQVTEIRKVDLEVESKGLPDSPPLSPGMRVKNRKRATTLLVQNLGPFIAEEDLKEVFQQYGEVSSVKVVTERVTNKQKIFGFVRMPNPRQAKKAIAGLNHRVLKGQAIIIREIPAQNRKDEPNGKKS